MQYGSAPEVRWLGLGPFAEGGAGQPTQAGVWAELYFTAGGKIAVHPTDDGAGTGTALFSKLLGVCPVRLEIALLGGSGDDADPETGATSFAIVDTDPAPNLGYPQTIEVEVTNLLDAGAAPAADGTPVYVVVFGVPA